MVFLVFRGIVSKPCQSRKFKKSVKGRDSFYKKKRGR